MYTPQPPELKVIRLRPKLAVVEVLGEHDLATNNETAAVLQRLVAENELVVLDLTETQFIDSTFLKNVKNAQHTAEDLGHNVLLQVGTERTVETVLEITNFLKHFDHVSSREEALAWAPA